MFPGEFAEKVGTRAKKIKGRRREKGRKRKDVWTTIMQSFLNKTLTRTPNSTVRTWTLGKRLSFSLALGLLRQRSHYHWKYCSYPTSLRQTRHRYTLQRLLWRMIFNKQIVIMLTCGATTKTEMNTKRIKLIHTKERKNRKNEPIPAPKYPWKEIDSLL